MKINASTVIYFFLGKKSSEPLGVVINRIVRIWISKNAKSFTPWEDLNGIITSQWGPKHLTKHAKYTAYIMKINASTVFFFGREVVLAFGGRNKQNSQYLDTKCE